MDNNNYYPNNMYGYPQQSLHGGSAPPPQIYPSTQAGYINVDDPRTTGMAYAYVNSGYPIASAVNTAPMMMNPDPAIQSGAPREPHYTAPPPPPSVDAHAPVPPPPPKDNAPVPPPPPKDNAPAPPPPPKDNAPAPPPQPAKGPEEYDIFETEKIFDQQQVARENKAKIVTDSLLLKEQRKIDALNREKEDNIRRIEAETMKKRKLQANRLSMGSNKTRKIQSGGAKNVFGDDDEEEEEKKDAQAQGDVDHSMLVGKGGVHDRSTSNENSLAMTFEAASRTIDSETLELIVKTASWAANNPEKYEALLQSCKNNEKLFFLTERNSAGGIRFLQEYNRLRAEIEVKKICNEPISEIGHQASIQAAIANFQQQLQQQQSSINSKLNSNSTNVSNSRSVSFADSDASAHMDSADGKKPRRNRWGPVPTHTPSSVAIANSTSTPIVPPKEAIDPIYAKQLREQKELQLLESRIREAAAQQLRATQMADLRQQILDSETAELQAERMKQYEALAELDNGYERRDTVLDAEFNNGVIEGGTWEHRKRAKEMMATAQKSLELTLLASDKHHIADFLPKNELDKFLRKTDAVSKGEALPLESDFSEHQIKDGNVGFQMLKRAGWSEGTALGADSSSSDKLLNPINISSNAPTANAGLGVAATHEVAEGDSEFDSYRKRMMLAYRFRPNPLNNPRRDYY